MIRQVALVSPYDFAQNGGVTEHVRQLTRQLRRRDIEVTILAPASAPVLDEPNLVSLGAVMPIPINGSIARTTLSPAVVDTVCTLLAQKQFDVIHLHEPLAPMLPLSVLNASPSPNVGTFHAAGERSLGYAASRKLLNWLAQRLTVRVAVSDSAARFAQQYFAGDYAIIPNGVDTQRFSPQVEPLPEWQDGRPTVLFVGRFEEPRKGFGVLLAAFAAVQQALPDARLLVVGQGDAGAVASELQAADLREVHFLGLASAEMLPRYYRTADVLCAPSTGQESFGVILVEAMSSGCPVVASDIEGYARVVTHRQDGLLVPPCRPEALAVALLHVLKDKPLRRRLAAAGPSTAAHYAWSDVSQQVIDVYEQAQSLGQPRQLMVFAPALATLPPAAAMTAQGQMVLPRTGLTPAPTPLSFDNKQGVQTMLTEPFEARIRALTQRVVGRVLGRTGITPNMLTIIGLLLTVGVTVALATSHLLLGGILVLLTSAFDMLDGALARATKRNSTFGAFFDSTIDRYSEALIFLGLLLHYQQMPGAALQTTFVYLAILGSLMVSYTRARAEALGLECKVGILARPERIILLSLGLIVGWLDFTLAILALFTNLTAVQRIYHVWAKTDGRPQRREEVVSPHRASGFASRDQSPS